MNIFKKLLGSDPVNKKSHKSQNSTSNIILTNEEIKNILNPYVELSITPITQRTFVKKSKNNDDSWFSSSKKYDNTYLKIKQYRNFAEYPEVMDAIDAIVNELTFSPEQNKPLLSITKTNTSDSNITFIDDSMTKLFEHVMSLGFHSSTSIADSARRFYIDGRIAFQIVYNKNKTSIIHVNLIESLGLYFDDKKQLWYYSNYDNDVILNNQSEKTEFDADEIIYIDSGLYQDGIAVSNLERIKKVIRQLETLEALLIPLRYNRSITRRAINVEVGDIPTTKIESVMEDFKNELSYDKYYDTSTGSINNGTQSQNFVEDYYFPMRNGANGGKIDILNETNGNGLEFDDILYFRKKLYMGLKVPLSKMYDTENNTLFNISDDQITQDEKSFFSFLMRFGNSFTKIFIEMMKAQAIVSNTFNEDEFNSNIVDYKIIWANENLFIEKMKIDVLKKRIELFNEINPLIGTVYPSRWVEKNVLNLTDEEIKEFKDELIKEEKYKSGEDKGSEDEEDEEGAESRSDELPNFDSDPQDYIEPDELTEQTEPTEKIETTETNKTDDKNSNLKDIAEQAEAFNVNYATPKDINTVISDNTSFIDKIKEIL